MQRHAYKTRLTRKTIDRNARVLILLMFLLTFIISACTQEQPLAQTPTSTVVSTPTTTKITTNETAPPSNQPVPKGCPPSGQANKANLPKLKLGENNHLIYSYNKSNFFEYHREGILLRYNLKEKKETTILHYSGADDFIFDATVSPDKQWVAFTHSTSNEKGPFSIEIIRVDGKEKQILYCTPASSLPAHATLSWSPDMKYLLFNEHSGSGTGLFHIRLLDLEKGTIHYLSKQSFGNGTQPMVPVGWQDNDTIYLSHITRVSDNKYDNTIYLLDIHAAKDVETPPTEKFLTINNIKCLSPSRTQDGKIIVITVCSDFDNTNTTTASKGPSKLYSRAVGEKETSFDITDGVQSSIAINNNEILYLVRQSSNGDRNGIWKSSIDGNNAQQLLKLPLDKTQYTFAESFTSRSYGSPDGSLYVYGSLNADGRSLIVAPLAGGEAIATILKEDILNAEDFDFAGWTTL